MASQSADVVSGASRSMTCPPRRASGPLGGGAESHDYNHVWLSAFHTVTSVLLLVTK